MGIEAHHYAMQVSDAAAEAVRGFDIVVIYADFRFLAARPAVALQRSAFMQALMDGLSASGGTFLTPAYSYTISGEYHLESTRTNVSALARFLLGAQDVERSEHPLFSYLGFGPQKDVLQDIAKSAFGDGSLYDRLRTKNACFLHLGRPLHLGNTMIHHVEQVCGASYRIHKVFPTQVYRQGTFVGTDYSAFVRRRDVPGEAFGFDFTRASRTLSASGLVDIRDASGEMPYLASYPLDGARKVFVQLFEHDPTSFITSEFKQY